MANFLLRDHGNAHETEVMQEHGRRRRPRRRPSRNPLVRFQHGFEQRFERLRSGYRGLLAIALERRGMTFVVGFMAVVLLSFGLAPVPRS